MKGGEEGGKKKKKEPTAPSHPIHYHKNNPPPHHDEEEQGNTISANGGGLLSRWMVVVVGGYMYILVNVVVRYLISIHPYSGMGRSPMFGDYEAQRHWMEITTSLPPHEWYVNSTHNDLLYWGLDYPPLTAYHSWLCGKLSYIIEPESMVLFSSRGYETPSHKIFMRMSVIVADIIVYLPAVYLFLRTFTKSKITTTPTATPTFLFRPLHYQGIIQMLFLSMPPALLLIDHGHFQYNGVSLGLMLASIFCILKSRVLLASFFFCLSLNYKQMSLYYSTTFFFYLLGLSIEKRTITDSICKVAKIGTVVLLTFAICWLPFLGSIDSAKQVLHRIFPVARGLFEDKVANFWCLVSLVIKFKNMPPEKLLLLSLGITIVSLLPTGISLLRHPSKQKFCFSLTAASLGYFLFSFQVHEKSILLPLLPTSLLILSNRFAWIAVWSQLVAMFSMYPLLQKDGVDIPYCVSMFVMATVALDDAMYPTSSPHHRPWKKTIVLLSCVGMGIIHFIFLLLHPPDRLPDLFVMFFAMYSFAHFFGAFIYFNYLVIFDPSLQSEFTIKDKST